MKVRAYKFNDFVDGALVGVIVLFVGACVALLISGVIELWGHNPVNAVGLVIIVFGIIGGGFYQMRRKATTPRIGGEEDV